MLLILILSCLKVSSSAVSVEHHRHRDFATDLNATNFDLVLRGARTTYAIVEFYAHWCPACRNYKPHYEKVARLFNGPGAVHPGIILMARVDCALKICGKLKFAKQMTCRFSIGHFPMLFWGPPSKLVSGWEPKQEKSEIRIIDDGRNADRLLNWINNQLGSSHGLEDERYENEHLQSNISDPGQIERAVHDVEEATSSAFDIILEHKMIKSETRASLIKFLQLMVAHHPSKRFLLQMFCRGSKNETRGFSCGLWVLLHSLSVRIEDGEAHMAFTAMCEFIHNFFICEECRQHFYEMCSRISTPFSRSRDLVLWLWNSHNKVNERLIKEESSLGTGDPKFPKMIWPHKQLCPSCYLSQSQKKNMRSRIEWDNDEVLKFLVSYYGKTLVTSYKDNDHLHGDDGAERALAEDLGGTTNAVVVPVGAALAIAVASCAFGALAWFWRTQQKNRKYLYLHTLKNI
ncbi:hypothetical protein LguiA_031598 [Lonicera macranthoides]